MSVRRARPSTSSDLPSGSAVAHETTPTRQARKTKAPAPKAPDSAPVDSTFAPAVAAPASAAPAAPDDVAQLVLLVAHGVLDAAVLRPDIRAQVEALASAKGGTEGAATGARTIFDSLTASLGEASVRQAVEELAIATNAGAMAEVPPLNQGYRYGLAKDNEQLDWKRDWGFTLLSRDNPAFRDGAYLVGWNQEAGQNAAHFRGNSPSRAKDRFEVQLRHFAPQLSDIRYFGSGSDATSYCFDLARRCGLERTSNVQWGALSEQRPMMAFFSGVYGGGRGESLAMNWEGFRRNSRLDLSRYEIESPTTSHFPVTDPAEKQRLEALEAKALEKLEAMAKDTEHPIGAIFIEPIQGSKGVLCYRPEFMTALRELADRVNLPIIADEVLTSGGRTGKFFAYEHYQGFEPDYVTFGKGMQVNGVAHVQRSRPPRASAQRVMLGGITTGEGSAPDFHKAAQVLTAIRDQHLMERATEIGHRLESILSRTQLKHREPVNVTAFGCLAAWKTHSRTDLMGTDGGERERLMPPMDLSDEALDTVERSLLGETPR